MATALTTHLTSHQQALGKLERRLPPDAGWVCCEVILPRTGRRRQAWCQGLALPAREPRDDQIARVASAFANDQRVTLMRCLDAGHVTFASLREATGMTAGRLQHHLKELALAGFLRDTRQRNCYQLSTAGRSLLFIMVCLGQWSPEVTGGERRLAPERV